MCSHSATGLVFGGQKVKSRQYPWAGAAFYNEKFYCGGNLGKLFNKVFCERPLVFVLFQ
jgi:hypothetical protein